MNATATFWVLIGIGVTSILTVGGLVWLAILERRAPQSDEAMNDNPAS